MENQKFINKPKYYFIKNFRYNIFKLNKNKCLIFFILFNLFLFIIIYTYINKRNLMVYQNYVNSCIKLQKFNKTKLFNITNPYMSICLPVYNMEKYLERALLSIINQSFQNFEIIIINDNSNDNTINITQKYMSQDNRIKIINHNQNFGVYRSRVDAVTNSIGEFIILMDPDDMLLNKDLFLELYNYNLKNNLDIIEFSVYYKEEERTSIYYPDIHQNNHYHGFNKTFIYQPELSNIIFFDPIYKNYTSIICRTIWNKLIRKQILIKSIEYVDIDFHNQYLITADDTPLNIMCFNYANNYSNINLPGYLYNIRTNSMSRFNNGHKHDIIVTINYLLYFKFFNRYIKDFNKDINFLYHDLKIFIHILLNLKEYKLSLYNSILISFIKEIINNKNTSNEFKKMLNKFLLEFNTL